MCVVRAVTLELNGDWFERSTSTSPALSVRGCSRIRSTSTDDDRLRVEHVEAGPHALRDDRQPGPAGVARADAPVRGLRGRVRVDRPLVVARVGERLEVAPEMCDRAADVPRCRRGRDRRPEHDAHRERRQKSDPAPSPNLDLLFSPCCMTCSFLLMSAGRRRGRCSSVRTNGGRHPPAPRLPDIVRRLVLRVLVDPEALSRSLARMTVGFLSWRSLCTSMPQKLLPSSSMWWPTSFRPLGPYSITRIPPA